MKKIHKLNFPTKADWETFKQTLITGNKDKNVADNWMPKIVTVIEGGQLPKLLSEPIVDEDSNEQWYSNYDTWAVDIVTEPDFDNSVFEDYYIKVYKPIMAVAGGDFEIVDEFK